MPEINQLLKELKASVGDMYVVHEPEDLIVYEYDGSVDKHLPRIVVLPDTTEGLSPWRSISQHGSPNSRHTSRMLGSTNWTRSNDSRSRC